MLFRSAKTAIFCGSTFILPPDMINWVAALDGKLTAPKIFIVPPLILNTPDPEVNVNVLLPCPYPKVPLSILNSPATVGEPAPVAEVPVPTHCKEAPALLSQSLPAAAQIVCEPKYGVNTVAEDNLNVPAVTTNLGTVLVVGVSIVIGMVTSRVAKVCVNPLLVVKT